MILRGIVLLGDHPDSLFNKTVGIVGGVSWTSSIEYYRIMNETVQELYGCGNSAKILMYSIEFGAFSKEERLGTNGDWPYLRETIVDAARRLKASGADFIVVASNTLNSCADHIERDVGIPVLRIYNVTGAEIRRRGLRRVALLGTKYTMEASFYKRALRNNYGIEVVTPNKRERNYINAVIFDELCCNKINKVSKEKYIQIINRLVTEHGAQGVVLGCTEIPLLIKEEDVSVPIFDTTKIHAVAAVNHSLKPRGD